MGGSTVGVSETTDVRAPSLPLFFTRVPCIRSFKFRWVARGYSSTLAAHAAEQQGNADVRSVSRKALKAAKGKKKSAGFG